MASRTRILSAAFASTAAGESPVRAVFSAASVASRTRASSISRSNKSSRRLRASEIMGLLQTALVLQDFAGDTTGVDFVSSRADGLLHGRHLVCIHNRSLGDGFFDLLQGARRIGQGDMVAGLCRCGRRGTFALRLVSYNAAARAFGRR